ncbi:MAG: MFS transporter [Kofleriaceae bacterium]
MVTAASAAMRLAGGVVIRPDERALLGTMAAVFALCSAGAAMTGAAADAMFLAELGPSHLGEAVAVSSALLAIVLAVVGGLADRLERKRVLMTLALGSAVVISALAALAATAPALSAVITLIGGKQLAAATDLAFWVVIAERLDARRSQRLVPVLAAAGGAGAAVGAVLVVPLAGVIGAHGVLFVAAGFLAISGMVASRVAPTHRVNARADGLALLIARSWRDGARAASRHPLARQLAVVVAAAGVFASLAYFALGVELASGSATTAELAALLGGVRAAGQLLTLGAQLVIAPRLLARIGTGGALLAAPVGALLAGLGLVVSPVLWVAIATAISARVLDASVETPAERLTQTLLPTSIRGRIGGFLDGTAKRAGAVMGGLLAAGLAGAPTVFYLVTALAAAFWLWAASRIARDLPALAVAHVAEANDPDAVVDDRAVQALLRELAGSSPHRAAEVVARLHERGRVDAVAPLVHAAISHGGASLWRSVIAVLDKPSPSHGARLLEAARAASRADRELVIRAVGLAGGVTGDELDRWTTEPDAAIALTADVARLRVTDQHDAIFEVLGDAIRDPSVVARVAIDELCVELARGLARGGSDRALEAARHLVRALRRQRGDLAARTAAFAALERVISWAADRRDAELSLLRAEVLELARDRVERGASPTAPDQMLTSVMRVPGTVADDAPEIAAALRLYGALLEHTDALDPEDLRRICRALGEPDDAIRAAAEAAMQAIGPAGAGQLIDTAAWGRRRARDRAAALLAELPVTPSALDRLIDAELDALDQTHAAIAVLTQPEDELVVRRLEERLREIAHTVLLLVAARQRSRAIARAAVAWRHARGGHERARTLAVIEAGLPRALVIRLVEAVDDLTPRDRAAALARSGVERSPRDAVLRAELEGRDRLARALVLHGLGAAERGAHRAAIASAAQAEASAASPADLLRRVTQAITEPAMEGELDMPTRVESLIVLGRVPLLSGLSTRQLADVAERARWSHVKDGTLVLTSGDQLDALIVVDDGELAIGDRRILKGETVDELACVAPVALLADLRVVRAARLVRLERVDFEELVDDVPGLAASVCRALGERARRGEDRSYRSPLMSRSG